MVKIKPTSLNTNEILQLHKEININFKNIFKHLKSMDKKIKYIEKGLR